MAECLAMSQYYGLYLIGEGFNAYPMIIINRCLLTCKYLDNSNNFFHKWNIAFYFLIYLFLKSLKFFIIFKFLNK